MQLSPERVVTAAERATYQRDGVVCLRGLLDDRWITHLRGAVEHALSHPGKLARNTAAEAGKTGVFHNEVFLWKNHPGFRQFIEDSPIAAVAAQLMASQTVRLYNDHLLVKEPGTDTPTPWHQDGVYFQLSGDQIISIWIGLDPVRRETGAMSFVTGSHRAGKMYRPVTFATGAATASDAFDGPLPDIDADPVAYPTVCHEMDPGDVTFHHALTLHGSQGNASPSTRRRGYAIRMTGDDVRWLSRKFSSTGIGSAEVRDGEPLRGAEFPALWPKEPA